jgi:hypothetical protein
MIKTRQASERGLAENTKRFTYFDSPLSKWVDSQRRRTVLERPIDTRLKSKSLRD